VSVCTATCGRGVDNFGPPMVATMQSIIPPAACSCLQPFHVSCSIRQQLLGSDASSGGRSAIASAEKVNVWIRRQLGRSRKRWNGMINSISSRIRLQHNRYELPSIVIAAEVSRENCLGADSVRSADTHLCERRSFFSARAAGPLWFDHHLLPRTGLLIR
jgi:hypothetical protein